MDTALTTGMLTTNLLSVTPIKKDVVQTTKDGFNNIFKKSLDTKKVENKEVKKPTDDKNKVTNEKPKENKESKDVKEKDVDEIRDRARKKVASKTKELKDKAENKEGVVDEATSKLDELLEMLDVDTEDLLIKDVSEKFDTVGPQNVETEKITLNIEDEENLELNGANQNVEGEFTFDSENLTDDMSDNKDNLKDNKFKLRDFRNNRMDNINDRHEVVGERFSVSNENLGINLKTGINNTITDMKEKIDVLKQVTEQMDVSLYDGKTESVMKLKPDDLGKVTIKLSLENGIISAKFLAESEKVKEILESGFNQLKDALQKQGMLIQEFSVSVDNGSSQDRAMFEGRRKFFSGRKTEKIENNISVNNIDYYDYKEEQMSRLWPDSTISFSA
ncbi:MAG: flagellar hook-length control protein FliK [Clostridia bacterium]|nr:flagellar hook-length control protein FliK [Clostridia bacterium]